MTPTALGIFAIALAVSTLFGFVICAWLLPSLLSRRFAWALALGVGTGLCSLIFFLFRRPMFTVEFALLIAAIGYLYRSKHVEDLLPVRWRPSGLGLILCGALGLAMAGLMLRVDRMPHGNWDGWAIWNTHARFLYRDGFKWKNDIRYSFHGDYPLLTPSVAARFWRYAGHEVPEAGALLGIMLALSGIAVLALTLSELRDTSLGMLLALVLIGTPTYLDHATSQYADVPLSFFILTTIALICLHAEREADSGILVLAGFTAGCAGWTKNEGLLFITATCVALLLQVLWMHSKEGFRRFLAFPAGLAVPLVVIVLFKLTSAARNDLIANQHDTINNILNLNRHALIVKNSMKTFQSFGQWSISPWIPLLAFLAFHGLDRRVVRNLGWVTGIMTLGITLAGYYLVYLVTPIDLQLHLDSSLDRLLLQLWPSFLLLFGLLCRPGPLRP